ncbi:MAG: phosphoribosylanthranilate isomerase [Actinobacteria bacterium]|nr:phosphoribosylanthranilate isomerase [Actinomycetota bacterium]
MTRIKFCGLRRPEDAALAVELGAWALGVIMWPKSPRRCSMEQAAAIADAHRRSAEIAGVFVDAKLDEVVQISEAVGLSIVQLHGDEGQQYCMEVARRTGCKVIKAFRVRDRSVLTELGKFREVDWHLLDTYKAGVPGGTGESFDWSFLRERRHGGVPLILSGGLGPGNIATAIETVLPRAVDVSSGVESAPGVKDHEAMREFAAAVRSVARDDQEEPAPVTGAEEEVLTLAYARREAEAKREADAERNARAERAAAAEREAGE